jgi:hypothetical protein
MTAEEEYLYHERLAICLAEGIHPARAEEIARAQIESLFPPPPLRSVE